MQEYGINRFEYYSMSFILQLHRKLYHRIIVYLVTIENNTDLFDENAITGCDM